MNDLKVHTRETAPDASQPLLDNSVKAFGSIPSLHGILAESPQLLEAYQMLHKLFQETSFNKEELTVVWQTINVEHECHYCVPAHAAIASMMKVDESLTAALRNREPLSDPKLQALHDMTLSILQNRGRVDEQQVQAFYAAGYGPRQLLEIILGLSQKVISNYVNHLGDTPLDERFAKFI